jgi:probable HAF family extracellular repeat protein
MRDLGTLGRGGTYSWATAINDAGQVVGYANTADSFSRAFLYENGRMSDLGTLGGTYSRALALNGAGDVVGYSETIPGTSELHAFLDSGGRMTDLNRLLSAGTGWTLESATGINDQGQVAGYGRNPTDYRRHGFLLTPEGGGRAGSPPPGAFAAAARAPAAVAPTTAAAPDVRAELAQPAWAAAGKPLTTEAAPRPEGRPHAAALPSPEGAEVDGLDLFAWRWFL